MRKIQVLLAFILGVGLFGVSTAFAAPPADVTNDQPVLDFPNTLTFHATITAATNITSAVLEYGTEELTCGNVIAKAFPDFTPATSVTVEWIWDMRQSGSLPPGATIWWHWRYTDATGKETVTDQKSITWLDAVHKWQTIGKDKLNLHWYSGNQAFAQDLLSAAQRGLDFNQTNSGLTADAPIDLYIYANTNDLKDAILYEPSWTGGEAFPDFNIVIIGISPSDLSWGRDAVVHELTHVLVGHLTFSCLSNVPTWLNEGLAVYSEGKLDSTSQQQLDDAIESDDLLTVRSLSAGFSEVASKANLSYAESDSIVKFLLGNYGQHKMTALLIALRDGSTTDEALMKTYGFNIDGLEAAWRQVIGAKPLPVSAEPTVQPTPTYVPTIVPISGAPLAIQTTATPIPTSSSISTAQPTQTAPPVVRGRPPLWMTLVLLGTCCFFILIFGVFILGLIVRSGNRKEDKNAKP